MSHLTTLDELKQQITILSSVEETDSLFVSVYLNLEDVSTDWRETLKKRARLLRLILKNDDLTDLNDALNKVEAWMDTELLPEAKSVAIFVRGTFGGAFMLPMQFGAPLPNWIAVYPTPNIYHLVELKDNYHRYIVLFALPDRASIMEINLGAVTTQAWIKNPNLSTRVSQEWGRQHYQVHNKHRGNRFLLEKIQVLKLLMLAGGHTHLILTGDPKITESISRALPKDLADKLVDVISASEQDQQADIVMATLSRFIKHEEQESRTVTENLIEGLRSQNLAVAGTTDTLNVLNWGEVDTLVMSSNYQPGAGWTCTVCRAVGIDPPETSDCPRCGTLTARPMDIREAILRLAGQLECTVEIVEHSDALMALGGVGCLLRTDFNTKVVEPVSQQKLKRKTTLSQ